jgi:hypothetical protein
MSKNKLKERYHKIVRYLTNKSFREIRKNKFIILRVNPLIGGSAQIIHLFNRYLILIHKRMENAPNNVLIGLFAHELSHPIRWEKKGFFESPKFDFLLMFDLERYLSFDEHETDKEAIRRGYARQLYANRDWRLKQKDKPSEKMQKRYMSKEEIKIFAKSINKW